MYCLPGTLNADSPSESNGHKPDLTRVGDLLSIVLYR